MSHNQDKYVAVLGASHKKDRYSNKALRLLKKNGYGVIPVHPKLKEIESIPVINDLSAITQKIHTLTLYAGPFILKPLASDIVHLNPGRVIFNPGTECGELENMLDEAEIPYIHGCTLVMLNSGTF